MLIRPRHRHRLGRYVSALIPCNPTEQAQRTECPTYLTRCLPLLFCPLNLIANLRAALLLTGQFTSDQLFFRWLVPACEFSRAPEIPSTTPQSAQKVHHHQLQYQVLPARRLCPIPVSKLQSKAIPFLILTSFRSTRRFAQLEQSAFLSRSVSFGASLPTRSLT